MKNMIDVRIFEKFLDTKEGQELLEDFNKEKASLEDPDGLIISLMKKTARPKKYLDIGGGTGTRTINIIRNLKCEQTDFLEPSKKSAERFSEKARDSGIDNFSVINSRFEYFNLQRKYDFITSIHSWYYIELSALWKLVNILDKNGRAFIFIDSKEDTIYQIQEICQREILNIETNAFEDLTKQIDTLSAEYEIHEINENISGLLENGNLTNKTKTIISFLSYRGWSQIPEKTRRKIIKLLKKIGEGKDEYPSRRRLIIIKK